MKAANKITFFFFYNAKKAIRQNIYALLLTYFSRYRTPRNKVRTAAVASWRGLICRV